MILAAVAAAPFLFTTQLVALALRHTFPANDPSVDSAVIGPGGFLIVRGLVIHDTGKSAHQPLIAAREVRVTFEWRELLSRRIRYVAIDGLSMYARAAAGSEFSMLELVRRRSRANPPDIGTLDVSGTLHSEPIAGFTRTEYDWPVSLHMAAGKAARSRLVTASIGDARRLAESGANPATDKGGFGAFAQAEIQRTAAGPRLILHRLAVRKASLALASGTLRHLVPKVPQFRGPITAALAALSASGEIGVQGRGAQISGRVDFSGARVLLTEDPRIKLVLHDAAGAAEVAVPFPPGPGTRVLIRGLRLGNVEGSIEADLLREYLGKLPAAVRGPIACTLDALILSGDTSGIGRDLKFAGPVRIQNLTLRAASINNSTLAIQGISGGGDLVVRPGRPALEALAVRGGTVGWASMIYGSNAVSDFTAAFGVDKGVLSIDRFGGRIFDGSVTGNVASVDLARRTAASIDLQVKSIDMHKVLANISPNRIDADGFVSGTGKFQVGENESLSGRLDLAFDGPGILRVGEIPALEQKLAGNFGGDLAQLAMQDLHDYPFREGKLELESQGTNTLLKIKFVRQPRSGAEKIKPRKEIINGREVWLGSLVVPTIDMSIPITGKSLADVLSIAAGLHPAPGAREGARH